MKLVAATVLPKGTPLSTAAVNVIALEVHFAIEVTVENNGCQTEEAVSVSLNVAGTDFFGEKSIPLIASGERRSVVVGQLPLPVLDKKVFLRVEVQPVPAETAIGDNALTYPVRFVVT